MPYSKKVSNYKYKNMLPHCSSFNAKVQSTNNQHFKMVNHFLIPSSLSLYSTYCTIILDIKGSVACTEAHTIKISPTTAVQLPAN